MMKVLLVEDDITFRATLASLIGEKFEVIEAGNGLQAIEILDKHQDFDLIISDQVMSPINGCELLKSIRDKGISIPFILITAFGSIQTAVEAMKLGANDFIQKPFSLQDIQRVIDRVIEFKSIQSLSLSSLKIPIITRNQKMINLLKLCEIIAKSNCNVLIEGESGVGKEVIARAIHAMSPRRNGPCIAINCGAIPDHLLESELFGFEKGSFTGADRRKLGKIELAHNGTLILDEISELPVNLQVKLLRVLQEKKIERLGGTDSYDIDFRVIAISNKNLQNCCSEGRFRTDLYYRLNVMPMYVPPLRDRKDDIPLLANYFFKKYSPTFVSLPDNVLQKLQDYDWPGNVRELQNACERAALLSQGGIGISEKLFFTTDLEVFNVQIKSYNEEEKMEDLNLKKDSDSFLPIKVGMSLEEVERIIILETLKANNFNQTKAAEILGVTSRTLRNKLAEYKRLNLL